MISKLKPKLKVKSNQEDNSDIVIRVGSVRINERGYYNVKVDRSSALGNPFMMGSESQRDYVCDHYQNYFDIQVATKGSKVHEAMVVLYILAKEHRKINLQCHCAPRRCHAQTIKEFLEKHLK